MSKKNKFTQELLKLVSENPELPIKFFTNWQVVCEDYGYWGGDIEKVEVSEIIRVDTEFGNYVFTSKQQFMEADEDDENREDKYKEAKKEKAIVVFIGIK